MKRARQRILAATAAASASLLIVGVSAGQASPGPVTRTFSFIGVPSSKTVTVVNIDSLTINARCNAQGAPVIFAFSGSNNADLFGRYFDGLGRLHIVRNSSFDKGTRGVQLSATAGDFDATGTILYEAFNGRVVTVQYAFDNATTLGKRRVCTVYGSYVAS